MWRAEELRSCFARSRDAHGHLASGAAMRSVSAVEVAPERQSGFAQIGAGIGMD